MQSTVRKPCCYLHLEIPLPTPKTKFVSHGWDSVRSSGPGRVLAFQNFFLKLNWSATSYPSYWGNGDSISNKIWDQDTFLGFQKPFDIYRELSEMWVLHKSVEAVSSQNTVFPCHSIILHNSVPDQHCITARRWEFQNLGWWGSLVLAGMCEERSESIFLALLWSWISFPNLFPGY